MMNRYSKEGEEMYYAKLGILFFMPAFLYAAPNMNELTKVFHHQSLLGDKLVCYFTNEPICNRLPTKNDQKPVELASLQFFMPMTSEGNEAKGMIKKIQDKKNNAYTVRFDEVTKPMKGVSLVITYDPKKIVFNYESFDAINTHKGLIFSFHHKEVLQQLKLKTDGLLQYACNKISHRPRIMLDYGHGGSDEGKIGCFNTKEKTVNLEVGSRVAKLLSHQGYDVFTTRNTDCFVALDDRTKYANKKNVDLFVSIHANASAKSEIQGIETYWMNYDLLKPGMSITNGTHATLLNSLKHVRSVYSQKLALCIHEHVMLATKKMRNTIDRKVKQSVAQVLLGSEMPSALIEIGFLSNPEETKMLIDDTYQQIIAQGIASGIVAYLTMRKIA